MRERERERKDVINSPWASQLANLDRTHHDPLSPSRASRHEDPKEDQLQER